MSKRIQRQKDRFAMIPLAVLESEAWRTLPHLPRTVLLVLAAQYVGTSNGTQHLSRDICRRFGLEHSRALKAAKELEARGLIVLTYEAKYTPSRARVPKQWALGWRDITHRGNTLLTHVRRAPDDWREWDAPKVDSGRYARSGKKTAVLKTAEKIQNCGPSAQCSADHCGPEAQPYKTLGDAQSKAVWCVRPGSAVAHLFAEVGLKHKAACGAVRRPDAYVPQSQRSRQASKRQCTACLRVLNAQSEREEGADAD